ncbi:MAG: hypothetical protein IAG10_21800, partial [Planctomycetaceae bacterium]|nr:hypothetical protein [Planctomycetaceae bacterium]
MLTATALAGDESTPRPVNGGGPRATVVVAQARPSPTAQGLATVAPRKKSSGVAADEGELPTAAIRVDTNLVLINVTVTDPLNRFVTGLEAEHFNVLEDKAAQKIVSFASEDAPL